MIYIDDREPEEVPAAFPNGVPTTVLRLDAGDFMFFLNGPNGPNSWQVGVERKTIGDFLNSMRSGHLADQVRRMSECYDAYWVLVEGVWRINGEGMVEVLESRAIDDPTKARIGGTWRDVVPNRQPVEHREWCGYMTSCELVGGVRFRWSRNVYETARIVTAIWSWGTAEFANHDSMLKPFRPGVSLGTPSLKKEWLMAINGIGPKLLKAALKEFDCAADVAKATPEQWVKIGVKPKTAEKIVAEINGLAKGG